MYQRDVECLIQLHDTIIDWQPKCWESILCLYSRNNYLNKSSHWWRQCVCVRVSSIDLQFVHIVHMWFDVLNLLCTLKIFKKIHIEISPLGQWESKFTYLAKKKINKSIKTRCAYTLCTHTAQCFFSSSFLRIDGRRSSCAMVLLLLHNTHVILPKNRHSSNSCIAKADIETNEFLVYSIVPEK